MNRNCVVASLLLAASSCPALASNTLVVNVADDPAGAGQGVLVLDKALTIQGPGATKLTISAQNASRVFTIAAADSAPMRDNFVV